MKEKQISVGSRNVELKNTGREAKAHVFSGFRVSDLLYCPDAFMSEQSEESEVITP